MRKIIFSFILAILFSCFISAEIIINQQPNEIYSLGDIVSIPVTIKSLSDISGSLQMDLICNGHQVNFYKNGIGLSAGEEKRMESLLVLTKEMIGELKGDCKIKSGLKEEYVLTNDFIISDLITIHITSEETEFEPGKSIIIKGGAIKENGEDVNGFIELQIADNASGDLSQLETINNGFFSINISLPNDIKAGAYLIKLNAYEKDSDGEITNQGVTNYNILIKQVPTNLEIVFENPEVEPGTNLQVKTILHDQTGEKIESNAIITIKNQENEILEQTEKTIDEFLEFPVAYNEPPANWTVIAVSNKLTTETTFNIKEKEDVKVELLNKTITITNAGNVFYNKSVLVKIGNESLNVDVSLDIDESQKYTLTAPDGEYQIEVITDEGSKITGMSMLTGKTIEIKEVSGGVISLIKHPFVWIFIIAILGFITFMVFKKGHKRIFFGRTPSKKKETESRKSWWEKRKALPLRKNSIVNAKNKAELSLSIKGNKQNASVVCLKIKNLKETQSKKSNVEETLQKIVNIAEENKAVTYENQDNLFFILAPIRTRTFKNEKTAVEIAQKIKEVLTEHNKLSKQKIEFGISLNYGTIIAKQEKDSLKFMSMGTLITTAKKIALISKGEIFLSEKINDKLRADVKTEKHQKEKIAVYTIKEMKQREENKKFIRSFLDRVEGKK